MSPSDEFEIIAPPQEAVMLANHLFNLRDKLKISKDVSTQELFPTSLNSSTWAFIIEIVRAWKMAYPQEYAEWADMVDEQRRLERTVREAVISGGYSAISYPERLFMLFKVFIPKVSLNDKKFTRELIKRVPAMKRTNYKL